MNWVCYILGHIWKATKCNGRICRRCKKSQKMHSFTTYNGDLIYKTWVDRK